jgi:hypothetical protein
MKNKKFTTLINFFRKNAGGIWGVLFFLVLLYGMLREDRRMKLFQNTEVTYGFLIEEDHGSAKFRYGKFYFFVKNKRFDVEERDYFTELSKGDTVLIEYAIKDPSVARVNDKYYMQKYKYLRNQ